jgi:hypothetical protein
LKCDYPAWRSRVELSSRPREALTAIQPNVIPPPEEALVFPNRTGGYAPATPRNSSLPSDTESSTGPRSPIMHVDPTQKKDK